MVKAIYSARFRRLSKEGFWIVFGQGLAIVGSLVGVRLLTGLLNPASYGELALGITVATLVNQVVLGPLANGVTRFYAPAAERNDLTGYLKAVGRLLLLATGIITLLAVLAVTGLLIAGRTDWVAIAIAALIFATLSGYDSVLDGIQNAARQRSVVALHQGIRSNTQFLVAAGLIYLLGSTGTTAMVGYAVGTLPVIVSQYAFFRKTVRRSSAIVTQTKWQEQMWRYSLPFATWGVFTWAQVTSDRWALGIFASTKDVGMYAVLFQLGYAPISTATGMAMQFLSPIFYQKAGDASSIRRNADVDSLSWRLTWVALGLTFMSFFGALLLHEQVFHVFVAKEYAGVSYLFPWMLLAGGMFAAGQTIALNLMSRMKTHVMVVAKIATAIFGCFLNFAGTYWYGIVGTVIGGLIYSLSYLIWMMVLSKKASESHAGLLIESGTLT